jgi:ABC-type transport system involved in multi-copper enzyme maturation permease subunit
MTDSAATPILLDTGATSRVRAWCTLVRFSVRQAVLNQRAILAAVLLAAPLALAIIVPQFGLGDDPAEAARFYWNVTARMMLSVVAPLTVMLYAISLLSTDTAEGTITYLLTRRLSRAGVFTARFAGTVGTVAVAVAVSQVGFLLATRAAGAPLAFTEGLPELWAPPLVVLAAVVTFGGIFAALGLLFRKPLVVAIAYVIIAEWLLANTGLEVREYSLSYYLRSLLLWPVESSALDGVREQNLGEEPITGLAAVVIAATLAITLGASAALVSVREFTRAREEEK